MLAILAMGACGGSGGEESQPTVASVAEKLGCTDLKIETENLQREFGAREEGQCVFQGEKVTVLTYNDNEARDMSNDLARQFGGIAVLGDRWTVRVDNDATAKRVQTALGGKLA